MLNPFIIAFEFVSVSEQAALSVLGAPNFHLNWVLAGQRDEFNLI